MPQFFMKEIDAPFPTIFSLNQPWVALGWKWRNTIRLPSPKNKWGCPL